MALRTALLLAACSVLFLFAACSSSSGGPASTPGAGGMTASAGGPRSGGGATPTGGTAAGAAHSMGGTTSLGGAPSMAGGGGAPAMGGASTSAGAGGTGNEMCQQCVHDSCAPELSTCAENSACSACNIVDAGAAGSAGCDQGAAATIALSLCVAITCAPSCPALGVCGSALTSDIPVCDACMAKQPGCCDALAVCEADTACAPCLQDTFPGSSCADNPHFAAIGGVCSSSPACTLACAGGSAICTSGFSYSNSDGSPDITCNNCLQSSCCTEYLGCAADAVCAGCGESGAGMPACTSNPAFAAASMCLNTNCFDACPGAAG